MAAMAVLGGGKRVGCESNLRPPRLLFLADHTGLHALNGNMFFSDGHVEACNRQSFSVFSCEPTVLAISF